MSQHIYAFGSICRGEYESNSDVDLLVCTSEDNLSYDKNKFSIYDYHRLKELWEDGNPFAWHLALEAKMIYSSDGIDFIRQLGKPARYSNGKLDCLKFRNLFDDACEQLISDSTSRTFQLSCIFLAIRNFATCYSLHEQRPCFSRLSPFKISPALQLEPNIYSILLRARVLSTRGVGDRLSSDEIEIVKKSLNVVKSWMDEILGEFCDE
ncbi:nucleotidyltransferase domain-containing protein [Aeromonas veronii]|uniref:nucleotidyltransferase domain-containing protein n=1 Tax=Aeromonas dhakensis TaxID=196024 RepID=UPI00191C93C5|nr:nucleotidyltransferase domain-containing protein [Aeromonas dhakensis]MBL0677596.1 nucleotidyltransferase domain-containing protein [Aeromonas dhakensis]